MCSLSDLLYQEGKYTEACHKFSTAMNVLGYQPGLILDFYSLL